MASWLVDPENERALRDIGRMAVEKLAPDESPLFDEIFAAYVEVARQGEVALSETSGGPFAFAGESELLTVIILPTLGATLAALLAQRGLQRVAELRGLSAAGEPQPETRAAIMSEFSRILEEVLRRYVAGREKRRQLHKALMEQLAHLL